MSLLLRIKNRGLAVLATAFPALGERFAAGYRAEPQEGGIPWTPVKKPLAASTIALVTTAGVHHCAQPPYDMHDHDGDPSFRELDLSLPLDSLTITHDYYDHSDADRDLNVILPVERLLELAAAGKIGALARLGYGFMGHITGPHLETLKRRSAPEVAERYQRASELLDDLATAAEIDHNATEMEDIRRRLRAREVPRKGFCWHCRKPLHARSETCAFCGERQS